MSLHGRWRSIVILILAVVYPTATLFAQEATIRFDPDASPLLDTRAVVGGKVLVRGQIEDRLDGWFLLDTGATSTHLTKAAADRMGAKLTRAGMVGGVGASVPAYRTTAKHWRIGPMTCDSPAFVVSRTPLRNSADRLGIIGGDLFSKAIVIYDAAQAMVEIHDPATWKSPPVEWEPAVLIDGKPFVRMKVEDHEALLEVDTGGGESVLLCAPAVEKFRLRKGRKLSSSRIQGPFGSVPVQTSRLRRFYLGALAFEDVPVTFAVQRTGWLGATAYDGLIGAPLLRQMVVIFDYPHRRISFTDRRLFEELGRHRLASPRLLPVSREYLAEQAVGAPDAVDRATYGKAWFPATSDGRHWLELTYAKPILPQGLELWGTVGQRGITAVSFLTADGESLGVAWTGTPGRSLQDGLGRTTGPVAVKRPILRLRLEIDTNRVNGTNVIDAVGLVDQEGKVHWAAKARADGSLASANQLPPFVATSAMRDLAARLELRGSKGHAERIRAALEK